MTNANKPWNYKNGVKVYIEEKVYIRNEDKAHDYEMEEILAGLHTGTFNEDEYYELKYDREYNQ